MGKKATRVVIERALGRGGGVVLSSDNCSKPESAEKKKVPG